jgi:pimeloyl-ACP methyl ester carboxylesterase
MATIHVNGVDIDHEIAGSGETIVLVHGSWVDRGNWETVAGLLAEDFRVISYDRRNSSRSGRTPGVATRRANEDDLAALIEATCEGPVHVCGNSYGGLVSLGVASRRPDLVRSAAVHEPPAIGIADEGESARLVAGILVTVDEVIREVEEGDHEGAARHFVEDVALGPGTWAFLPEVFRDACKRNARTFAAEASDPDWLALDLEALGRTPARLLLSNGDASPYWLQLVAERLGARVPAIRSAVVHGAGHSPHVTHPADYAALVADFVTSDRGLRAAA